MTDSNLNENISYATYYGSDNVLTTGDGKYKVLQTGSMINCQPIDSEGFYIKSNRTPGEEVIGPCKILDSKAFKHDVLYMIEYKGDIFETLGSLSNI